MKVYFLLLAMIGANGKQNKLPSWDLFHSSLVLLEAAMPAPHTLSQLESNKNVDKDFLVIENQ